jgi:hypothetical protein
MYVPEPWRVYAHCETSGFEPVGPADPDLFGEVAFRWEPVSGPQAARFDHLEDVLHDLATDRVAS